MDEGRRAEAPLLPMSRPPASLALPPPQRQDVSACSSMKISGVLSWTSWVRIFGFFTLAYEGRKTRSHCLGYVTLTLALVFKLLLFKVWSIFNNFWHRKRDSKWIKTELPSFRWRLLKSSPCISSYWKEPSRHDQPIAVRTVQWCRTCAVAS